MGKPSRVPEPSRWLGCVSAWLAPEAEPVKPWLEPFSKYFLLYEYILNIKDTKKYTEAVAKWLAEAEPHFMAPSRSQAEPSRAVFNTNVDVKMKFIKCYDKKR
ncbi:hypothetical protein PsorP6_011206 [Peronosclerospora sorghi]|uniref:Uncharacterized protein n=1 Tax=Peronosclerospora sorghi TaxID=230839 RepID=A0ACC0VU81_9STRA|nr:hypothetical protein PsorP6_011206 [Peronosclerospora sorghi]